MVKSRNLTGRRNVFLSRAGHFAPAGSSHAFSRRHVERESVLHSTTAQIVVISTRCRRINFVADQTKRSEWPNSINKALSTQTIAQSLPQDDHLQGKCAVGVCFARFWPEIKWNLVVVGQSTNATTVSYCRFWLLLALPNP